MKAVAPGVQAGEAATWAALLEGLPEAAWLVDLAALHVVAANAAAASLFGRDAERLVGEPATRLAGSPEDLALLGRCRCREAWAAAVFVAGLPGDDTDAGIVFALLQMARALGMKVVAEGVETEAQRQFLLDAGCDEFQGWLFAPALDSLSFEQRLTGAATGTGDHAPPPRIRLVSG